MRLDLGRRQHDLAGVMLGLRLDRARNDQRRQPSERRHQGVLAQGDFVGEEILPRARDQRPHHGVLGHMGLDEAAPALDFAARPARHLVEKLERALGRARIALGEAEVAVHHAHQGQIGEVMALGHDLGADDDPGLPRGDACRSPRAGR